MPIGPLNNSNDTPIGSSQYRVWNAISPSPNDGDILRYRNVSASWTNEPLPVPDASSLVRAGYGGIQQLVDIPFAITTTPTKLPATTTVVDVPVNVTQDTVNDGLAMALGGVWQVSIFLSLYFTALNAGRLITLDIYNNDSAQAVLSNNFAVGRDAEATSVSLSRIMEIEAPFIGNLYSIRIYSSDTFANVTLSDFIFTIGHMSYI
jgi:hypothetical protein